MRDKIQHSEYHIKLGIYEYTGDPESLTALLRIEPTKIEKVGDNKKVGPADTDVIPVRENAWILEAEASEQGDFDGQLKQLLEKLAGAKENLREITKTAYAEISVACYSSSANFGVHFSKEQLRDIVDMGLELDIDIYPED